MPAAARDEESTAAGIYGVIVGAAVMAASHAERVLTVAVAVLVTLGIYWTAERYARLVAARIHDGHRPTATQVRHELTHGWEMVTASAIPLVVLAVTGAFRVPLFTAVLSALVASTVMLCLAGWAIGRHGRLTRREQFVSAAVAGLFGVAMILLKTLLH
jgi:positive regulator of sigma E activity